MGTDKSKKILIDQIFIRAQNAFLSNPLNEEAKRLFKKSFELKMLREQDEKFDIFGFEKELDIEKELQTSTLIQKSVIDPPFGMKAALCLGSVNEFQKELIAIIESLGYTDEVKTILNLDEKDEQDIAHIREKGQIDFGTQGSDQKIGLRKSKYAGALKDIGKLKWGQKTELKPITYDINKEEEDLIRKKATLVWIPFDRSKMAGSISTDNLKGSISPLGAGELEFCARMLYAAEKGMQTSIKIPSKIQMQSGVNREEAEEQETFLLNLGNNKGVIADRCKSILESYMDLAVRKILAPLLKFKHVEEYAYEGVQKAIRKLIGIDEISDEISEGKYDFEQANIGAWTYQVARNYSIDKLKGFTKLVFDNSKAAELASGLSFPFKIVSKIPADQAKGSFENFEKIENKKTGKVYFVYTYADKESFLDDLQTANGYNLDIDSQDPSKRGRKRIYQPNNPLYFKNISSTFRGNFMTSIEKYVPSGEQYTDLDSPMEKKESELEAAKLVDNIKDQLSNISKDIINKILKEPDSNAYGQNKIKTFLAGNRDLASSILLRILGYGVYKFVENESLKEKRQRKRDIESGKPVSKPEGYYEWMTKPELYLDDFINTLQDNEYLGQGLPNEVVNRLGTKNMPIRQFVQLLRKVVLGSGVEGSELEKYFKTGSEQSDEFKTLVSSQGFLLKNPGYLRNIYSLLKQLPQGTELGNAPQKRLDEDMVKIKKLIQELKSDFDNYNKNIFNLINL